MSVSQSLQPEHDKVGKLAHWSMNTISAWNSRDLYKSVRTSDLNSFKDYLSQLMRYGTYHMGNQRGLRRAFASAQSARAFAYRTHEVRK